MQQEPNMKNQKFAKISETCEKKTVEQTRNDENPETTQLFACINTN